MIHFPFQDIFSIPPASTLVTLIQHVWTKFIIQPTGLGPLSH